MPSSGSTSTVLPKMHMKVCAEAAMASTKEKGTRTIGGTSGLARSGPVPDLPMRSSERRTAFRAGLTIHHCFARLGYEGPNPATIFSTGIPKTSETRSNVVIVLGRPASSICQWRVLKP